MSVKGESPRGEKSYSCALSNDLVLKATKELHEKAEWRARDIQAVRDFIGAENEKFNTLDISDSLILKFLRARKFDYERSSLMLCKYLRAPQLHPEIFLELLPSTVTPAIREGLVIPTDLMDYHASRIVVVNLTGWKMDEFSGEHIIRALLVVLEFMLMEESVQISGVTLIIDLNGITLANVIHTIKPSFIAKYRTSLQECLPCRIKAIHVIHDSIVTDAVLTLCKPFLSDKMRQRMHFHGQNTESLLEFMDVEDLPLDIQGKMKKMNDWQLRMSEFEAYMKELGQLRKDVPQSRASDLKESGLWHSVLNSYRRLCIDGLNS